jgi:hypothetical protein
MWQRGEAVTITPTLMIWLLIVMPSGGTPAVQHGPFADLESCQRVQSVYLQAQAEKSISARLTRCVEVKVFTDQALRHQLKPGVML